MEVYTSFAGEDLSEQISILAILDIIRCFLRLQIAHVFPTAEEPAGTGPTILALSQTLTGQ